MLAKAGTYLVCNSESKNLLFETPFYMGAQGAKLPFQSSNYFFSAGEKSVIFPGSSELADPAAEAAAPVAFLGASVVLDVGVGVGVGEGVGVVVLVVLVVVG